MLVNFSVGTGVAVSIPNNNTLVVVSDQGAFYKVVCMSNNSGSTKTYGVPSGDRYYVFSVLYQDVWFANQTTNLFGFQDLVAADTIPNIMYIYKSICALSF